MNGTGSAGLWLVYISRNEAVIAINSTNFVLLLERKSQIYLISDANGVSAIFSWSTRKGYYISNSNDVQSLKNVIQHFESLTSLKEIFNAYKEHGKQFSFTENGDISGALEVEELFKQFVKFFYLKNFQSIAEFWYSIYTFFVYTLPGPGVYEIHESGHDVIEDILHFAAGSSFGFNATQTIRIFLEVLRELSENSNYFGNDIAGLLQGAGINQSAELIGFLRFIQIFSSLNVTAAYNAIIRGGLSLTPFILLNCPFSEKAFQDILGAIPGIGRFLRLFIRESRGQNWISIFGSFGWRLLLEYIPGLRQAVQFFAGNSTFGGLISFGESFAGAIGDFARNIAKLANSSPIPNPFGPVIGAFAGGVEGAASQANNGLHLFGDILNGGQSGSQEGSDNSESRANKQVHSTGM